MRTTDRYLLTAAFSAATMLAGVYLLFGLGLTLFLAGALGAAISMLGFTGVKNRRRTDVR